MESANFGKEYEDMSSKEEIQIEESPQKDLALVKEKSDTLNKELLNLCDDHSVDSDGGIKVSKLQDIE